MVCNRISSLTLLSLGLWLGLLSSHQRPVNAQFSSPNRGTPIRSGGRTLEFSPPDRGAPESADGGATRQPDCMEVVPLMPVDNRNVHFGLTYQEHPNFYWYMGNAQAGLESAEIIIERDNHNGEIEEVHRATISLPPTLSERDHILSFSAPANEPGLVTGESYRWFLEVQCNPVAMQDPTSLMIYQGWIERVEPDVEVAQHLSQSQNVEEPAYLYGTQGIWFDYLHQMTSHFEAWSYILAGFGIIPPDTDVEVISAIGQDCPDQANIQFFPILRDAPRSED